MLSPLPCPRYNKASKSHNPTDRTGDQPTQRKQCDKNRYVQANVSQNTQNATAMQHRTSAIQVRNLVATVHGD